MNPFIAGLLWGIPCGLIVFFVGLYFYVKVRDTKQRISVKSQLAKGEFLEPLDPKDYDTEVWKNDIDVEEGKKRVANMNDIFKKKEDKPDYSSKKKPELTLKEESKPEDNLVNINSPQNISLPTGERELQKNDAASEMKPIPDGFSGDTQDIEKTEEKGGDEHGEPGEPRKQPGEQPGDAGTEHVADSGDTASSRWRDYYSEQPTKS